MNCCRVIPSGNVCTMKILWYSETRYGTGWISLSCCNINRAAGRQVVMRVALPQPTGPGPITVTRSLVDEDQAYVYFDAPLDGNAGVEVPGGRRIHHVGGPPRMLTSWPMVNPRPA